MSLLDDVNEVLKENDYIFIPEEVDNSNVVHGEIVDQRRWYDVNFSVVQRGDEYVGIDYQSPSTELQEGEHNGQAYYVEPYEKIVTAYRKV